MEKLIDLHIHTNCSDGALTPKEIIDEAYKNGINTIAICDHDTTEAYQEEIFNYAKEKNINLIVGVEISTKAKKYGVHVLGYNFDLNNKEFQEKLYTIRNARHIYLRKVATKLEEAGYKIDVERLDKIDAVSKAHIAYDVIENKENETKLKEVFGHIPDMGEFIETIMNEDCPCYVRKETISPKEASELIHHAGGKVVLAHPVAYTYEDNLTEKDIDDLVIDMKPDGIETNYIYIDKNNIKHNDIALWNNFAKKHNLQTTVGSDFHRKDNIHPYLGFIGEDINLTSEQIEEMINFLL
jgi:3',5'-nucleoside bisphosphate phosphatase